MYAVFCQITGILGISEQVFIVKAEGRCLFYLLLFCLLFLFFLLFAYGLSTTFSECCVMVVVVVVF